MRLLAVGSDLEQRWLLDAASVERVEARRP